MECSDETFLSTYISSSPKVTNSSSVTTSKIDNTLVSSVVYTISDIGTTNVGATYCNGWWYYK